MARIPIQLPRGSKAALPALESGELALVQDEEQLYMGGPSGNEPVMLNHIVVGSGNGSVMGPMSAPGGPANPHKIVAFAKLVARNGTVYWVPLFQ